MIEGDAALIFFVNRTKLAILNGSK